MYWKWMICCVLLAHGAMAQVSKGGRPLGLQLPELARNAIPTASFPALLPDELTRPTEADFRYGVQRWMDVDVLEEGQWDDLPSGDRLCRITLRSPGAVMVSVQFDQWELPEGGRVFLYDSEGGYVIGAFDRDNRSPTGGLATQVVPGEAVTIEYVVPGAADQGALHIASITHAFLDIFGFTRDESLRDYNPGYQSAPCHINVVCPEAAAWQDQKRSVTMFLRPDGAGCSAGLLNNAATPGRPFMNVAHHCLVESTLNQWVFYFNYDAPACVGSVGPTDQTMSGATMRSNWVLDDMCLLEMNTAPPASYSVYYAGWDRSGNVPQRITVIEHPLYDVKKIAFDYDPPTTYTADGIQMWRTYWDNGITEWGASGAPCFDQNKRFIGHMVSGNISCTNGATTPAGVGKFSEMWDGASSTSRVRDWLDPSNTVVTLDGYDPNAAVPAVKLKLKAYLEGPYNTTTAMMDAGLRAAGMVPLTEPYTALGYAHVGGGGESTTSAVLAVSSSTAVVDWVVVELRNKLNSTQVLATRSALLLRNGSVVATDGASDVSFSLASDNYFIALRHRNHLGIMTNTARTLGPTATLLDLSNGSVPLYTSASATKVVGGKNVMFAGDVVSDGIIRYTGLGNDRDPILGLIGGVVPTNTQNVYNGADVNMDGVVRYTGASNDRDFILQNIGGTVPTQTRAAALP